MITFVSGKIGSGKSALCCKWLLREYCEGTRAIVTNLPLLPEAFRRYAEKHCRHTPADWEPGGRLDTFTRIRILTEDQCHTFWRFREARGMRDGSPDWITLPAPVESRTDFQDARGGVLYCIDEVHLIFPSRAWQKTGPAALHYLSQSRKLGDDVILASQFLNQVDVQLRQQSGDYVYVRNWGKEGLFGIWRMPKKLSHGSYPFPGDAAGRPPPIPCNYRGSMTLSSEVLECYDTAAGVGLSGKMADKNTGFRGLPLWTTAAPLALLAIVAFKAPDLLAAKIAGTAAGRIVAVSPTPQTNSPAVPTSPALTNAAPAPLHTRPALDRELPPEPPTAKPVGWVVIGRKATAYLDDGSTVTPASGLQSLDRNSVTVYGKRLQLHQAPPPRPPADPVLAAGQNPDPLRNPFLP